MPEEKKEHWRIIKEFPDYMINQFGVVRNKNTGHLNLTTQNTVRLQKDGKTYHRGFRKLLHAAFPEIGRK